MTKSIGTEIIEQLGEIKAKLAEISKLLCKKQLGEIMAMPATILDTLSQTQADGHSTTVVPRGEGKILSQTQTDSHSLTVVPRGESMIGNSVTTTAELGVINSKMLGPEKIMPKTGLEQPVLEVEESFRYNIAKDYLCPMTGLLFKGSVTLESGQTFERKAVAEWYSKRCFNCSVTRKTLQYQVIPPTDLFHIRIIDKWKERELLPVFNEGKIIYALQVKPLGGLQFLLMGFQSAHDQEKTSIMLCSCIDTSAWSSNFISREMNLSNLLNNAEEEFYDFWHSNTSQDSCYVNTLQRKSSLMASIVQKLQNLAVKTKEEEGWAAADSVQVQLQEPAGMRHYLTGGAWDPHDLHTVSLTCDSSVQIWDLRTMKKTDSIERAHVRNVDYDMKKRYMLVTAEDESGIHIWDLRKLKSPVADLPGHSHWTWTVKCNPAYENLILSAGTDSAVNLWLAPPSVHADSSSASSMGVQSRAEPLLNSYNDYEDSVYGLAWSSREPWIFASLSYDGRVVVESIKPHLTR